VCRSYRAIGLTSTQIIASLGGSIRNTGIFSSNPQTAVLNPHVTVNPSLKQRGSLTRGGYGGLSVVVLRVLQGTLLGATISLDIAHLFSW
jgi:hypothetical protein